MSWFYNLKIKSKLLIGFGLIALITAITGYISYSSINKLSNSSIQMYEENLIPISQLQRMTASFGVIRIRIREMFTAKSEKDLKTFSKSIDKEIDSMKILSGMYEKLISDDTERKNWVDFKDSYEKYMEQILHMRDLLFAGKNEEALDYMNVASKPMAVLSRNNLDKVVDYNLKIAEKLNKSNLELTQKTDNIVLMVVIFTVLLASGLGLFLANIISKPINLVMERLDKLSKYDLANLKKGAEEFAEGKLDIKIDISPEKLVISSADETGKLSETINNIIDMTQASIQSVEHVTNTVTLMAKEINVLVDASVNGNLSRRADAEKFKGGFKEIFVGLNHTLDSIIGPLNVAAEYVDRISKGNIPAKITDNYKGDFNELKSNLNTCIDAVNLLIKDSDTLAKGAVEGNLSVRADVTKHFGDFRKIIEGVNSTLDAVINPLTVAANYVAKISKGEIPKKITDVYNGDFNILINNLNICIDAINLLVIETDHLSKGAVEGNLVTRADASKHFGDFRKIVEGINKTLDSVIGPLKMAASYVERIAIGDIPEKITDSYNGDFNEIKDNINLCIDSLNSLINEMVVTTKAQKAGDIEAFADVKKFNGVYQSLIEGYNDGMRTQINGLLLILNLLKEYAEGDLKNSMPVMPGKQIIATERLNQLRENVMLLIADVNKLSDQAIAGNLSNRADASKHQGDFKKIIEGMNKTLDSVIGPLKMSAKNMDMIAKGNVPDKITDVYNGDFNEIKNNLNTCIDAINALVADSILFADAAVEGRLSVRADVGKHQGDFRKIIEGFNNTLDSVTIPIKEGVTALEKMASGDLTVRIKSEYKGDHQLIKNSINSVGESLNKALLDVSEAVAATASASNQISSSTEEMAAGASNQTQQTAEVAGGVEEMTKTILENTKNATHAADAAKEAGDKAKEGGRVVTETIEGMNKISDVVKKSAETVQELGKSSDQIGEIVQVIDDIADQTNLLALNAAIEAARAGEQGRGFAVVADEVRKLAERTTKATKEIATMIRQIQKDTNNAVQSMEEGTKEVDRGKTLANKAGDSLYEIVNASQKVLDIIAQVAAASEEQSTTAEEISRNIETINSLAQEGASGTQQIAKAAEDLTRLTLNLEGLVSKFQLGNESSFNRISHHQNEGRNISYKGHKGYLQ